MVFIVEGVRFLGKNCIIFEICDNCIIEREEKYLKYKESLIYFMIISRKLKFFIFRGNVMYRICIINVSKKRLN